MLNLSFKSFQNIFLYQALWSLKFSGRGLVWVATFFGHVKFVIKKFSELFCLWSALDSEFVSGVWVPTFFGHAKFDWTLNFSEGVSGHQLFLVTKFEVKNFSEFLLFNKCSGLWIFQGGWRSGHQHFLVTPNLRSIFFWNFLVYRALWTLNFLGRVDIWTPTFLGHAKFEVKIFSEFFHWLRGLDFDFFGEGGGPGTNFFWSCQIEVNIFFKIFFFYRTLWTMIFIEVGPGKLFLAKPILRSKCFQNFFLYQALWSQFFRGWLWPNFFGQIKYKFKKFSEYFTLPRALVFEVFS